MSRESSELNAIENLYESSVESYMEVMEIEDVRDINGFDLELMWKAAEKEFDARGV